MIVHIFGCPNAGKTTLRNHLEELHPEFASFCIDDFRRMYSDGTVTGELYAQDKFIQAVTDSSDCFVESSGAGRCAELSYHKNIGRDQRILFVDTPLDVCIERYRPDKYIGIPFCFRHLDVDDGFIRDFHYFLHSDKFEWTFSLGRVCRIDGSMAIEEEVAKANDFLFGGSRTNNFSS